MLSGKLGSDEIEVIKNKYAGKRIDAMSDPELLPATIECLKRIHIITGWNLPDDSSYIKLLSEEFLNKLKESFSMLNFSEITFAFRKNVGIKDWGKNMNLDLICNVLALFCDERLKVSMEEERILIQKDAVQKIYTDAEILDQRRGHIEEAYQAMRKKKYPILHVYFKEVLFNDGFLESETDEDINLFFVYSLNSGRENIYLKQSS